MKSRAWLLTCAIAGVALCLATWLILAGDEPPPPGSPEPSSIAATEATPDLPAVPPAAELVTRAQLEQSPEPAALDEPAPAVPQTFGLVSGRVLDEDNQPVQGARVELRAEQTLTAIAGARGEYSLKVPYGVSFALVAHAPEFAPFTLASVTAGDEVACVLRRGFNLRGIVRSSESRAPIAGALVAVSPNWSSKQTRTASDGSFRLSGFEREKSVLIVMAAGYEPGGSLEITTESVEIELEPGKQLKGWVRDQATGLPIAKATVAHQLLSKRPAKPEISRLETIELSRTTDETGAFSFDHAGLNGAVLIATAPGYASCTRENVPPEEATSLELLLAASSTVQGLVLDHEQQPVAGASVDVPSSREIRTRTDRDGRFSLEQMVLPFELRVRHALHTPKLVQINEANPTIELLPGASVRGTLTGPDAQPVASTSVVLIRKGKTDPLIGGPLVAVSQADGSFAFDGLPAGDYGLTVRSDALAARPTPFTLGEGETREVSIELMSTIAINGDVRDTIGRPLSGVLITSNPSPDRTSWRTPSPRASSDDAGAFCVRGLLPDAPVTLEATRVGYAPSRVSDIVPGSSGVIITLTSLGAVRGRVLDALSRRPVETFAIALNSGDKSGEKSSQTRHFKTSDGAFVVTGLKPGLYQVRASADDYRAAAMVACEVEEHLPARELELLLVPGGVIRGVVQDSRGENGCHLPVQLRRKVGPRERVPRPQIAVTGVDGSFRFTELKTGKWELWIGPTNQPLAGPETIDLAEGSVIVRRYTVAALGSVEIQVRDQISAPLKGATVSFSWRDTSTRDNRKSEVATSTTDQRGVALVKGIMPGEYEVIVRHRDCDRSAPLSILVLSGGNSQREIVLRRKGS